MPKYDFNRTNVDVNSLNVSAPNRSSFDLSKNSLQTIPFGILYPTRCTKIIPGSTIKGSVNPDLQLEKFATPAAGRMRLDTHTFIVPSRRIHNQFKQFIESGMTGRTADNLPSSNLVVYFSTFFNMFFNGTHSDNKFKTLIKDVATAGGRVDAYDPQKAYSLFIQYIIDKLEWNIEHLSTQQKAALGNNVDFLMSEKERLTLYKSSAATTDFLLGDVLYTVALTLFGEGSTMEQLGYPCFTYYGGIRELLNDIDAKLRDNFKPSLAEWTLTAFENYLNAFGNATIGTILLAKELDTNNNVVYYEEVADVFPVFSEMPLRANYSVWFDYFRNWHLEPESSCLNPDDFGSASLVTNAMHTQLLIPRKRNWSRDGFTMVQPDDVYRHVFAPGVSNLCVDGVDVLDANHTSQDIPLKTYAGFDQSTLLSLPFPFTHIFGDIGNDEIYLHDLQTMRRTEMLRHKLTRDYYNPDTYVGQHFARYGVEPEDMSILCSKYLGGNESMINGSQQIANIGTEETTVGQRTLVANASSKDEFIYNTSEHAYLINYVSIVPLVHYDALDMTLQDISVHDQVIPEYANDNQVMIRTCDMIRNFTASGKDQGLGYVPRYYGYRTALDDVHGKYLREYRSYTWLRDFKNDGDAMLTKNSINEHINLPLDCFLGLKPWDTVAFGPIDMPLFVECALPAKLENV